MKRFAKIRILENYPNGENAFFIEVCGTYHHQYPDVSNALFL